MSAEKQNMVDGAQIEEFVFFINTKSARCISLVISYEFRVVDYYRAFLSGAHLEVALYTEKVSY
jgi:hypothetical protein